MRASDRPPDDSTYTTPALAALVARAAQENRVPPTTLGGYTARIESELALIVRDTLGREQTGQIEQVSTQARWDRSGEYDLRMAGYRSESVGIPSSLLSFVQSWTVPTLYGDRLSVGVDFRNSRRGKLLRVDTARAVHPFASDRARYYRFSGGDTVTVLHIQGRAVPIVRVIVQPHFSGGAPFIGFDGEINLDADRAQIVRMRGQFVTVTKASARHGALLHRAGLIGVAYVEFVNHEVAGQYWLPSSQRTEFQGSFALLGQIRPVLRIVSTFDDYAIAPRGDSASASTGTGATRVVVSSAPHDSLDAFGGWARPLGAATASVHADDFQDVAPDAWRPSGAPRLDFWPHGFAEAVRFNRIEGLYLGSSATLYMRDALPGASVGVFGGWATAEHTPRGGVRAALQRSEWLASIRADRELPNTNDFTPPLGDDPGFAALLSSIDDADYVDRRIVAATLSRVLGSVTHGLVTGEVDAARDAAEQARISRGLFLDNGEGFRPNRNLLPGRYVRGALSAELHPNVSDQALQNGIGGAFHIEAASGDLRWQRAEFRGSARQALGPVVITAHADAGAVWSKVIPPQQMFELGGTTTLPGYDYKQFAGDQAALFRALARYRAPVLRRPIHLLRGIYLPGISPGFVVSAQGGWTRLSTTAARTAAAELLAPNDPGPPVTATGGVRATVGFGLTFLSDAIHVGLARPIDHPAPWRLVAGIGTAF